MRKINILILLTTLIFSCASVKHNKENKNLKDFEINFPGEYYLKDKSVKRFIEDFIEQPECKYIKMYHLGIDQRHDTLICTLIEYISYKYPQEDNYIGYFKIKDNIIMLESPLAELIDVDINSSVRKQLREFHEKQTENIDQNIDKIKRTIVWQLQIPIFSRKNPIVIKDISKIHDTYFHSFKVKRDTLKPGESLDEYFKRNKNSK